MLAKFVGQFRVGRKRTVRGSLMPMFAVMSVPVVMSVGVGVDLTRVVLARADLQGAVDGAALAAATAAGSQSSAASASTLATTVATTYFNGAGLGPSVSITPGTLTIKAQTSSATPPTYTVTVAASATMATTFLNIASMIPGASDYSTVKLGAHATASNPVVPGSDSTTSTVTTSQPVIKVGSIKSSADDWNSAYLYAIPINDKGVPTGAYPDISKMYEIGSNCNSSSTNYKPKTDPGGGSACNKGFQPTPPANQILPSVSSDQPLAILFVNMTGGLSSYPENHYKSQSGWYNLFSTAEMSSTSGPAKRTDDSHDVAKQIVPSSDIPHSGTTYATSDSTSGNCSVLIQQIDPGNPPLDPPAKGSCFSHTDTASGVQFANLTCGQMAGRTFMFWWNDMGGSGDDKDYNDLWFSLTCAAGTTATNGGTTSSSTTTSSANAQKSVTLIQ